MEGFLLTVFSFNFAYFLDFRRQTAGELIRKFVIVVLAVTFQRMHNESIHQRVHSFAGRFMRKLSYFNANIIMKTHQELSKY